MPKNKRNVSKRTHTHVEKRTHNYAFRVMKTYPYQLGQKEEIGLLLQELMADLSKRVDFDLWVRFLTRIHVLPYWGCL